MRRRFNELRLTGSLPSPPSVGATVLELAAAGDDGFEELVRSVGADPALAGRLIWLANSAGASGDAPVRSAEEAAGRLGVEGVRSVALGFTLVADNRRGEAEGFDFTDYWARALIAAVAARELARAAGYHDPAAAFTGALLRDVGRLALACIHPERYTAIVEATHDPSLETLARAEERELGIDHLEVSAELMAHWGLPEEFGDVARRRTTEPRETGPRAVGPGQPIGGPSEALAGTPNLSALVLSGRQAARVALGSWRLDDADWVAELRSLVAWSEELGVEVEALLSACDGAAGELEAWGERTGLPLDGLGRFRASWAAVADGRIEGAQPAEPVPETRAGGDPLLHDALEHVGLPEAPARPRLHEPTRILLIDDDPLMLRLISFHLEREGFELLTAGSSAEGLSLALEHTPQIVITDWMMPELSGVELCRTLRRSEAGARMRLIIVTACGNDEQVVEAFDAGADDFVAKPFNPRILLARVRAAERGIRDRERAEAAERMQLRELTEREIMVRKLRAAAMTDALTQLPNRRYAVRRLKQEWESMGRSGRALAVTLIDVDDFKRVNDGHGHDTGDAVLRSVSRTLEAHVRGADVLCRIGGEEFLLLSVGADAGAALAAAERLRRAVEAEVIEHGGFREPVTISLGVALTAAGMESFDDLIKAADQALYRAKESGRNRVCGAGRAAALEGRDQSDRRPA